MPVKATTAPMSARPCVNAAVSAAASNGSRCRRMVADISSASGHRRKDSDLARSGHRGLGPHMGAVDCRADDLRILERMRVLVAALGEPGHQVADGRDSGRQLDVLLRLADALAHPCEIDELHAFTCRASVRRSMAQFY